MPTRQTVQIALLCLETLEQLTPHAMSPQDLSRRQGLPLPECLGILRRLSNAGIVEMRDERHVRLCRPVEELTVLDVLQALWSPEVRTGTFQMFVGGNRRIALRKTLEFVRRDQASDADSTVNG